MKIGIFDSGVGGLLIARAIQKSLPEYDYVYLGDTKRVPYGNRPPETVYEFTKEGVEYLLTKERCGLVILACNTASALALRKIQKKFSGKKILGVLIPATEHGAQFKKIGVIGTNGTVASGSFPAEIHKINKGVRVFQNAAPMLVPLAEAGESKLAEPFLKKYIEPLLAKHIDALVLGCTHYPIFKKEIKKLLPKDVRIISQDEIVPKKLKQYLARHPEIARTLSRGSTAKILVTDRTKTIDDLTKRWFGKVGVRLVKI